MREDLTEGIGEEYQTDHDDGKDDRGYLQVFLEDTTVPDSTKAPLLEYRGAVLVMMVVVVMMLLFHISEGCLRQVMQEIPEQMT